MQEQLQAQAQEPIKAIMLRCDYLEKLINVVQQNVNFNIVLTWTILGVVVAITGVALLFLARAWVSHNLQKEIKQLKKEILNQVQNYKLINVTHNASIEGAQIVDITQDFKACIINAYFTHYDYNFKFIKSSFTVIKDNSRSMSPIIITNENSKKIIMEVNEVLDNRLILTWKKEGDIPDIHIGLDILVF